MKIKNHEALYQLLLDNAQEILLDLISEQTPLRGGRFSSFWRNSKDLNCSLKNGFVKDFVSGESYNIYSFATKILNIEKPVFTLSEMFFPNEIVYDDGKNGYKRPQNKSFTKRITTTPKPTQATTPIKQRGFIPFDYFIPKRDTPFHTFLHGLGISDAHLLKWHVGGEAQRSYMYDDGDYTTFIYTNLLGEHSFAKSVIYGNNCKRQKIKNSIKAFYRKDLVFERCFFGEHLIDISKPIAIVESEKSAVLSAYYYPQYNWLATGGVNSMKAEYFAKFLGRLHQKCQNENVATESLQFYYFADADAVGRGIPSAEITTQNLIFSLLEEVGCIFIDITASPTPKEGANSQNHTAYQRFSKGFDIADYILEVVLPGIDALKELPLTPPLGVFAPFFKRKESKTYHITTPQYLHDIRHELVNMLYENQCVIIEAEAGSGKTTTFLNHILPIFENAFFAVPQTIQASQIAQEYNLITAYENVQMDDLYMAQTVKVGTYNKIAMLLGANNSQVKMIVIDEAHILTDAYGYRSKTIEDLQKLINLAKKNNTKIVYLSATQDKNLVKISTKALHIVVKQKITKKVSIKEIIYDKKTNISLTSFLSTQDWENGMCRVIRIDSKKLALSTSVKLIEMGLLKEADIDFVFSDKHKDRQARTHTHKHIEKYNLIPENKKLIFVTKIFDTGINILNTNIEPIYCTTRKELARTKVQFFSRFRAITHIEGFSFTKEEKPTEDKPKKTSNESKINQLLLKYTKSNVENFNLRRDLNLNMSFSKEKTNNAYLHENNLLLLTDDTVISNDFKILHELSQQERFNMTHEEELEYLKKHNIEIVSREKLKINLSKEQIKSMDDTMKIFKEKEKENEKYFLKNFKTILKDTHTNYLGFEKLHTKFDLQYEENEVVESFAQDLLAEDQQVKFVKKAIEMRKLKIPEEAVPNVLEGNLSNIRYSLLKSKIINANNLFCLEYEPDIISRTHPLQRKDFSVVRDFVHIIKETFAEMQNDVKSYLFHEQVAHLQKILDDMKASNPKPNQSIRGQIKTLQKRISELKSYTGFVELEKFVSNVYKKISKISSLKRGRVMDEINTIFHITRQCVRMKNSNAYFDITILKIGAQKTLSEVLIEVGLTDEQKNIYIKDFKERLDYNKAYFDKKFPNGLNPKMVKKFEEFENIHDDIVSYIRGRS